MECKKKEKKMKTLWSRRGGGEMDTWEIHILIINWLYSCSNFLIWCSGASLRALFNRYYCYGVMHMCAVIPIKRRTVANSVRKEQGRLSMFFLLVQDNSEMYLEHVGLWNTIFY